MYYSGFGKQENRNMIREIVDEIQCPQVNYYL